MAQVHQLLAGMQAAGIVITNGDWNAAANGLMTCWCHAGRPPALLEAAWTLFLRRTCPADFMPCSACVAPRVLSDCPGAGALPCVASPPGDQGGVRGGDRTLRAAYCLCCRASGWTPAGQGPCAGTPKWA